MNKPVKGYKVFNPDWTCRGFKYAVGETFEEEVELSVCHRGFHFCEKAADCFNYYHFDPANKVAEVLALGDIVTKGDKSCTNKIQIVREIPWAELLEIVNTGKSCSGYRNSGDYNSGNFNSGNFNSGDKNSGNWNSGIFNSGDNNSGNGNTGNKNSGNWNSGNFNSGDYNSGNRNSGDCNSGNCNCGNRNSGSWNSGNFNSGNFNSGNNNSGNCNSGDWNKCNFSNGCFNTVNSQIYLFNKPSEWTFWDWRNSMAYAILSHMPNNLLEYVTWKDMTSEEKNLYPEAEVTGGYLKKLNSFECNIKWWCNLSDEEKAVITAIPNFDKEIFKEITGIDIDEEDANE